MYEIRSSSAVKQDVRKLPREVVALVRDRYFPLLKENPLAGGALSGEFVGLRSFHFRNRSVEYRVMYRILEQDLEILIVMIGPRENIYKKLKYRDR
jgi:mRNA-degrading endonuclease RelE of RelBE toxin-antitoxin system